MHSTENIAEPFKGNIKLCPALNCCKLAVTIAVGLVHIKAVINRISVNKDKRPGILGFSFGGRVRNIVLAIEMRGIK